MHHATIVTTGKLARRPRHAAMDHDRIEGVVRWERTRQYEVELGQASIGRAGNVHGATVAGERRADFRRCWPWGLLMIKTRERTEG